MPRFLSLMGVLALFLIGCAMPAVAQQQTSTCEFRGGPLARKANDLTSVQIGVATLCRAGIGSNVIVIAQSTPSANANSASLNSQLFDAIKAKDIDRVRALLASGAGVNVLANNVLGIADITPLSYAVVTNSTAAIVRLLLENGADVNFKDPMAGATPLTDAVTSSDPEVVALLLAHGADMEVRDVAGYTPLMYAAATGHTAAVKLLLDHGAAVDAQDDNGVTSLQLAAGRDDAEILQSLLEKGADVNHRDKSGRTPLIYATGRDVPPQNARLLLAKGAELNAKDDQGRTAFDSAQSWNNRAVMQILVAAGANGGQMPPPPTTGLTSADVKFLSEQCHIDRNEIDVIPKLEKDAQQLVIAKTALRNCALLHPFTASRAYFKQLNPNTPVSMPPSDFDASFLTADEQEQFKHVLNVAPWSEASAAAANNPATTPPANNPPPAAPANNVSVGSDAIEVEYWRSIENSTDPADFKAYLNQFPNGHFRELAWTRYTKFSTPQIETNRFAGKWVVQARDSFGANVFGSTWELTVDGNNVQVKGEWGPLKFQQGHIDGDKITLDWLGVWFGGAGGKFEGSLVNPKRIEGRWESGIFSNVWRADKL